MLPEDNSFNWGAVLLRLLPWEQTQRKDLVMSVLRALAYNPSLAVDAPKWQPKARFMLETRALLFCGICPCFAVVWKLLFFVGPIPILLCCGGYPGFAVLWRVSLFFFSSAEPIPVLLFRGTNPCVAISWSLSLFEFSWSLYPTSHATVFVHVQLSVSCVLRVASINVLFFVRSLQQKGVMGFRRSAAWHVYTLWA